MYLCIYYTSFNNTLELNVCERYMDDVPPALIIHDGYIFVPLMSS